MRFNDHRLASVTLEFFDLLRNSSIPSFPRRWESSPVLTFWIPVCTGMTNKNRNSEYFKGLTLICLIFLLTLPLSNQLHASSQDETWLLEQFKAGQFDTLRNLLPQIPDDTGMGQFLRGLFEESGDEARFYFDRVIVFHSGSPVEPYAMQRLWQYHHAKGDMKQAERYYGFLKQRHPDFDGLVFEPDFTAHSKFKPSKKQIKKPEILHKPPKRKLRKREKKKSDPVRNKKTEPAKEIKKGNWTVQVGAFTYRSGAQKRVAEVQRFGKTMIRTKLVNGKLLSLVHIGQFEHRKDAEQLIRKIQKATSLEGRVVAVN